MSDAKLDNLDIQDLNTNEIKLDRADILGDVIQLT